MDGVGFISVCQFVAARHWPAPVLSDIIYFAGSGLSAPLKLAPALAAASVP